MLAPETGSGDVSELVSSFGALQSRLSSLNAAGGPWTFNLRDLMKWCQALSSNQGGGGEGLRRRIALLLFAERFRTEADRRDMAAAVDECLKHRGEERTIGFSITEETVRIGRATLERARHLSSPSSSGGSEAKLLQEQHGLLESLCLCLSHGWIPILAGGAGSGKTRLVSLLAELSGRRLSTLTLSSMSDTSDLLGGYDQSNSVLRLLRIRSDLLRLSEGASLARSDGRRRHLEVLSEVQQSMAAAAREQRVKEGKRCLEEFAQYMRTSLSLGELKK